MDDLQKYRLKKANPNPKLILDFLKSIGLEEDGVMITSFCQGVVTAWASGTDAEDIVELVQRISFDDSFGVMDVDMKPGREELADALALICYSGCHLRFKRLVNAADLDYLTNLILRIAQKGS